MLENNVKLFEANNSHSVLRKMDAFNCCLQRDLLQFLVEQKRRIIKRNWHGERRESRNRACTNYFRVGPSRPIRCFQWAAQRRKAELSFFGQQNCISLAKSSVCVCSLNGNQRLPNAQLKSASTGRISVFFLNMEATTLCCDPRLMESVQQQLLRRVFQMCDVQRRGHISIDDLLELGQSYLGQDTKDLADALRSLDPLGDGTLTFDEFCRGVGSIIQSSTEGATSRDLTSSSSSSSPTKRSRTLIDWSELTMPLVANTDSTAVTTVDESAHLVVNDEDILLASDGSLGKRRNSSCDDVDSGYSKSSTPTDSAPTAGSVSGCSSMSEREISFEGYGEADHSIENGTPSEADSNPVPPMIGSRTSWMNGMLRSSLRRSDYNSQGDGAFHRRYGSLRLPGKRGVVAAGSNALASQLYSKNVNNTSSRSSNGGDNEDFCSDASLEDDVVDLGHKVQILQQQITALADTQFSSDDRYSRSKQENAALTARLQMLEESLRDVELRAAQQLTEEQRRNKELIVRVEREKQLEIENCTIKLQAAEREVELTREECARLRGQTERLRGERSALQQRLCEAETSLLEGQEELRRMSDLIKREREQWAIENATGKQLTAELLREVEMLRVVTHDNGEPTPTAARVHELENEIKTLKQQNNSLREANDELQAQLFSRGLEEGRTLLNEHLASNSLAAEFEVMSQDDIRTALREQQEVNAQLRSYIEGILLTIVENQPSLLERKPPQ